ncbi:hypothetical protein NQ176_g2125 [Zarea fungicola]|uniref:Uncharacterized protein n=1 Tax=Zarea fungicola TaxID=93591 RepID=A0ACC1NRR1_9HYPO|nr:hypothetical protein NQ176_g2125 [Lecanicillium fungicola]
MHIAILTFDGFNELDSFIALGILNRLNQQNSNTVRVSIASPTPTVRSMNGIVVTATATLEEACAADAVVIGSGAKTREVVEDNLILSVLRKIDPARQLIAAQCSGALLAAKLGLLDGVPACTDDVSKPWVIAAGVEVVNQPFIYHGNVATAGGCLASHYLATWLIRRLFGTQAAKKALSYVVPVGEQEEYIKRALNHTEQEGVI